MDLYKKAIKSRDDDMVTRFTKLLMKEDEFIEYGHEYGFDSDISDDITDIIDLLESEACIGNENAMYNLGRFYQRGRIVEKDTKKAVVLFERAAALNHIESARSLAFIYEYGEGVVKRNCKKAVDLYKKLASVGDGMSLVTLAAIYQHGLCGVERDLKKAVYFYEKSVELGNPVSMNRLGGIYEQEPSIYTLAPMNSFTIPKDIQKAIGYYEQARKNSRNKQYSFISSCYRLSVLYKNIGDLEKSARRLYESTDKFPYERAAFHRQYSVKWRREYHIYWMYSDGLINKKILYLLLSSKHRKNSKHHFWRESGVNGVVMIIIQFLCHFKEIIKSV